MIDIPPAASWGDRPYLYDLKGNGDKLIEWLNEHNGKNALSRRAGEVPHLVYSDGNQDLFMAVTAVY